MSFLKSEPNGEKQKVDRLVGCLSRTDQAADRLDLIDVYIALKSKPLLILAGPAGSGKIEFIQCLGRHLMGSGCERCQMMLGHPWWAGCGNSLPGEAGGEAYLGTRPSSIKQQTNANRKLRSMNAAQKHISSTLFTACGGKITDPSNYPSELFEGQRVYFCEESCRRAFLKDPARFMAGEIDHFAEGSEDA